MKMGTVVRNIQRTAPEKLAQLRKYGTATVHEAIGRTGLLKPNMRPITQGQRAAGNALTVLLHPGDNTMMHVAIEFCQPGDVLVAACSADCTDGMVGELLGSSMMAHGASGLVIDAGCRDVSDLIGMGFPVWSIAISAKGTVKTTLGQVNTPIVCAGAVVQPGDVVVADDDGVVIVPYAEVDVAINRSQARLAKEAAKRSRLQAGELGIDIENIRPWLEEAGIRYYGTLEEAQG
jgi:4-hydroxy-4-methyl-2-oxoglutarate aldolase